MKLRKAPLATKTAGAPLDVPQKQTRRSCADRRNITSLEKSMFQIRGAGCRWACRAFLIAALPACLVVRAQDADLRVTHVIGLPDIKWKAKGTLNVQNGSLQFSQGKGKASASVPVTSIDDVFTGSEITQAGGMPATIGKMAVPYGGGRVLSLFLRSNVDVLTIAYRDESHGLHGVIFVLPKGQAPGFQQRLATAGAHVTVPPPPPAETTPPVAAKPDQPAPKGTEPKPNRPKLAAAPIQIHPVEVGEIPLPEEFRLAIYEYVVEDVKKSGVFPKVYRAGDRDAEAITSLLALHIPVDRYKAGSETKRAVTTVGGFTYINVNVAVSSNDGKILAQKPLEGRVRFYGDNLRVTSDLASRINNFLKDNFVAK
jgi:hypothetical protein